MKKRNLFNELMQGMDDMAMQREEKTTLRQIERQASSTPEVTAEEIIQLRQRMNVSQAVFARYIRTSLETLRNWEQAKAKPNTQAALLIRLVASYPDMLERLEAV